MYINKNIFNFIFQITIIIFIIFLSLTFFYLQQFNLNNLISIYYYEGYF